jgi:TolB-like protein
MGSPLPDVFLSYDHSDQATVRRFAEGFEREGLNVWWDVTLRSGEAFDQAIEKALKGAKAVVVFWSRRSVESRWVRAEATLADRNQTLVPVMIEPCERPIMFELTQTAELAHWQGAADDKAWLALLADVRRLVENDRRPTPFMPTTAAPAPPTRAAPTGASGEAPSLAVLPFTNRSGLPEDDVFAFGMVEDVIDALSHGVYVRVITSAATAGFRKSAITDLPAVARQLGVHYLLEGNVRRTGSNLRVTAQLVEAASGAILWTQRFDRLLTELAALQEALVLEVAAHLDTQVFRVEMERALKKPGDLTAWEAVMRAIAAHRLSNVSNFALCAEEARKALAIAPDYSLAHAVLAYATSVYYIAFLPDDAGEVRRIRGHADRALALDPGNALVLAYVSLALTYAGYPEDGLRHGERAVRLNPGAGLAHHSCGMACLLLNRVEESLAHLDVEIKASPGAPTNCFSFTAQGGAHIRAGRWTEAIAACDRALELNPDYPFAVIVKAIVCKREGRTAEACDLLLRTRQAEPAGTLAIWERVFKRQFSTSPNLGEILEHLHTLWAETNSAE